MSYHKEGAEHLVVENLCFKKQNNWLQSERKNSAVCRDLKPEAVSLFSRGLSKELCCNLQLCC